MNRRLLLFSLVICALVGGQVGQTWAENGSGNSGSDSSDDSGNSGGSGNDDGDDDEKFDQDRSGSDSARDAVQNGRAVPLRRLLAHLKEFHPGKILDIDLKRSKLRHSYRVKLLTSSGKVLRLKFDALTLQRL